VDILQRILASQFGVHVHHVLGMTDVDDKIIARAWERSGGDATARESAPLLVESREEYGERTAPGRLARHFESCFHEDMRALGVRAPLSVLRVSEHIADVVEFVDELLSHGAAYRTDDGSVYFDTTFELNHQLRYERVLPRMPCAGVSSASRECASGEEIAESGTGAPRGSLAGGTAAKRRPADFALWKAQKPGEPAWQAPWGWGRPGWHIECRLVSRDVGAGLMSE
jgi:cysteinyl-tRNA synthetase